MHGWIMTFCDLNVRACIVLENVPIETFNLQAHRICNKMVLITCTEARKIVMVIRNVIKNRDFGGS